MQHAHADARTARQHILLTIHDQREFLLVWVVHQQLERLVPVGLAGVLLDLLKISKLLVEGVVATLGQNGFDQSRRAGLLEGVPAGSTAQIIAHPASCSRSNTRVQN